ncbi:hypothetical protein HK101_006233, partial [Irineochytrium annulatum]
MAGGDSSPTVATILDIIEIPDKDLFMKLLKSGTSQELVLKLAVKSLERERERMRIREELERQKMRKI